MTPLPIDPSIPELLERLCAHRRLVLVAPPGAGKTTRVPAAIVKAGLLSADHPALVLLQPRRVAARAVAGRIARENRWTLGEEVGYQIRFERRIGPKTRLRVATEGILNRQLIADPFLEGIGAVVLDEFHERSLHTDLALGLLREVQETVREDLLLVVMSATLDAEAVARFMGGCPVLQVKGRAFPVAIEYRPAVRPAAPEAIAAAVEEALAQDRSGDVLVFLPGAEEIRRAGARLEPLAGREDLLVLPLHGTLDAEEQDRALQPDEAGRRKVVLATNIAETSLTIEGITTVVDSGLARYASFDPQRGLDRLELRRISRASATQRAGRAGRTRPGRCVRLWSEREQRGLIASDPPEVACVDLCGAVLALHAWGLADAGRFSWFEPPPSERLDAAERLLVSLGALESEPRRITSLGCRLLNLPVHPRLGRLLLAAAADGYLRAGAALAALLSEKEIVRTGPPPSAAAASGASVRPGRGASDLLVRLDLLAEAERARFAPALRGRGIDPAAARRVARVRDELVRLGRRLPGPAPAADPEPAEEVMLRWIVLAYPDRVVRRRGPSDATGVMVGGRGVRLSRESVVRNAEFFVALDPREQRRKDSAITSGSRVREAQVAIASAIGAEWLEELFPESLRRERTVEFDDVRQRAVGTSRLWYHDLLVREDRSPAVDPDTASAALAAALRPRAVEFFQRNEDAAQWLARLDLLRRWMPEAGWPEFDPEVLAGLLDAACVGKRSVEEFERTPLVPLLRGRLTHAQSRLLDEQAPQSLVVPSGQRVRLTYAPDRPPVLAVRLQELFGWTETPRVAGGRLAVVLQLLGPNFRPVQITDDLRSFWASTYFQVRKDLRARYPRHAWPDDPLTATARARGKRRS
jgi:ATP-dependent helicase HrpB